MGFVCLGCSENELVNERQSMGEIGWIQKNKFEIPFEITDTSHLYDMQVAIRQTNTYSFYNLYFISEIVSMFSTKKVLDFEFDGQELDMNKISKFLIKKYKK